MTPSAEPRKAATRLGRAESQELTRTRLLEAARALVARVGYHEASVEAIAAEAGYTKGAFYSNFESKEALFCELMRQHKSAAMAELHAAVQSAPTVDVTIERLAIRAEQVAASVDWILLDVELQLHALRSAPFAEQYARLQDGVHDAIARLISLTCVQAQVEPPSPGEARAVAAAYLALTHGLILERHRAGGAVGPGVVAAEVRRFIRSHLDQRRSASPR